MTEKYQPVACGLHSEYELLAMHQSRVMLAAVDDNGKTLQLECRVKDMQTRQGAEYLVVTDKNHAQLEFRLDRIQSVKKYGA